MIPKKHNGFTIIELLTVIAIIGVLAAMIFPVVASSRESAKKAQCTSNLHNIWTALKQFQMDEHRYPDFIAGPAYRENGVIVPLNKTSGMDATGRAVSLYPEYIKEVSVLNCPRSIINGEGNMEYKQTDVIQDPLGRTWYEANATDPNNPEPVPAYLYKYSSYDYQCPKPFGSREAHYSIDWPLDDNNDKLQDNIVKQLKWRNPPAETVVAWCSYHRDVTRTKINSSSKDLVLFLDGHVKLLPSLLAGAPTGENGWQNAWRNFKP
ncbi:MAG: type II secretion system protein [Armatimonadota bacterium]|nr:type II secretion system protein [Armatimonadota bacterium]